MQIRDLRSDGACATAVPRPELAKVPDQRCTTTRYFNRSKPRRGARRVVLHRIRDTHTILADQWRHECDANISILPATSLLDRPHARTMTAYASAVLLRCFEAKHLGDCGEPVALLLHADAEFGRPKD